MAMKKATHLTQIQVIIILPLLASFLVSGDVEKTQSGSSGLQINVPLPDANGSEIKVTRWSVPIIGSTMSDKARRESAETSVTSRDVRIPKTMKSCKASQGLCSHNCLTGCCDERCSNRFKNGVGNCIEPMLPTAPCLCHYKC